MTKKQEVVEEPVEENGTPAIFLRKVDVVIQNEDEEPIIIKAEQEDEPVEENQNEEE